MTPTPLTAPYRVIFRYTTRSFQHQFRAYCNVTPSGDSSGYDMVVRAPFTNVGLSLIADQFWNAIKPFYKPVQTTFDSMTLEKRTGSSWVFVTSTTTAVVATGAADGKVAFGHDTVGKDAANRNIHAYLFEGDFGDPAKIASTSGMSAAEAALTNYLFNTGGSAINKDMWAWRTSKGTSLPIRWLAVVVDTNEKLRRLRRIK